MKENKKNNINFLDSTSKKMERGFIYLRDILLSSSLTRILVAFGASLIIIASITSFVFRHAFFDMYPVSLLGCFTYYADLNIANRLNSITLFMLGSMPIFFFFLFLFNAMQERERDVQLAIIYTLLPSFYWLSSIILRLQDTFEPFWLYLSSALCVFAALSLLREHYAKKSLGSTKIVLFAFGLSFWVTPAILAFIKSPLFWLSPFWTDQQHALEAVQWSGYWLQKLQYLPSFFVFLLWLIFPNPTILKRFALFPVQIILLSFFSFILPSAFWVDDVFTQFFEASRTFYFIFLPIFIIGIWDCIRRAFSSTHSSLSPFSFIALLLSVFLRHSPIPGYSNLYEFGSRLPEFWVSFNGWASLFKDVYITYGLWDYAEFLFAWVFSGQYTAAVTPYGAHLFRLLILMLEFFAVASILPVGLTFLLVLVTGVGGQSVVLIFVAVLLHPRLIKQPIFWIPVWIILSAILPFARIPQGTIAVIATVPAFLWQFIKLFKQNRKDFWKATVFLGGGGVAMTIWPFGGYFWGLLRIFRETASVNSPWAANGWNVNSIPFVQVLLGNALMIMPLVSIIATIIIVKRGYRQPKRFVAFFLLFFVLLYSFLGISYGFSRTDWQPYLRQLQVLLAVLLPLLAGLMAYVPSKVIQVGSLGVLFSLVALLQPVIASPRSFLINARKFPVLAKEEIQDASKFGLPHLGIGRFPEGHLQEESALKEALDGILAPDETYFDLTMEGLHYFSSQRKLITEYPVYYVYPGDIPQLRAIEQLEANDVNVTLLDSSWFFDESPSSLRAHYLYRYALLNGLPLEITTKKTLLLPPKYFSKLDLSPPDLEETLILLDKQFPMTDFAYLPGAWGRGFNKTITNLVFVHQLEINSIQTNGDKKASNVLFPPLQGVDAGLLILTLDIPTNPKSHITIQWESKYHPNEKNQIQFTAINGVNIVPLDASPRWLLAEGIDTIIIKHTSNVEISELSLYQRPYLNE
jgi:hypothetical protein